MQSLISVIIPVYNIEAYINKCVESVVNQTYKNLEIILVDDGSTDNCPEMCEEWAEKDNRIKVVHKQNGGLSSARNAGMDNMHGEYVVFIDGDDYIENNMIDVMYANIMKDNYDICVCNYSFVDKNYHFISSSNYKNAVLTDEQIMLEFLKTSLFNPWYAWNKLYKCSIIKKYNFRYDEAIKWGEDYPFNYMYFKVIDKMISIDDALYNYLTEREGSITYTITSEQINRWKFHKQIVFSEKNNQNNYVIAFTQYASILANIAREIVRTNNKAFMNKQFKEIVNEIKINYNDFMKLENLNKSVRFEIKLIHFSPVLFKILYRLLISLKK